MSFIEADETGHINIPILEVITRLDVADTQDGIGLSGLTLDTMDGTPMKLRIQMTNEAAISALSLLLRYAEETGQKPSSVKRSEPLKRN